jgi:hypothetical protein
MNRFPGSRRPQLAENIVAGKRVLLRRERPLYELGRDLEATGFQAERGHFVRQPGRQRLVMLARRIDRGKPHQVLQPADEVGGVAVDVVGGCHGFEDAADRPWRRHRRGGPGRDASAFSEDYVFWRYLEARKVLGLTR